MYSNPSNTDTERIVFLEDTIQSIYNIMKHIGCDISDKDSMPIEQLVGREISKRGKSVKSDLYSHGTRVALKDRIGLRGTVVETIIDNSLVIGSKILDKKKCGVIWDKHNNIEYYESSKLIEEKLLPK